MSTVTQNDTGIYHLRPQKPKNFWGRTPRPPLKEDVSFGVHLTSTCIHYRAVITHFQAFWSSARQTPDFGLLLKLFANNMALNQDIDNSGIAH